MSAETLNISSKCTVFKRGLNIPSLVMPLKTSCPEFFAGSSRRTFHKVRPSTDPNVRLSRIRLLIWLIVCLISVYPTLFSLKSISSSCQSLCIGQVSFLDIAIYGSLPSSGITHLQRYYGTIRLPIFLLSLFLLLTRHTLLLFSKAEKI